MYVAINICMYEHPAPLHDSECMYVCMYVFVFQARESGWLFPVTQSIGWTETWTYFDFFSVKISHS